jgi:hypothetical protein
MFEKRASPELDEKYEYAPIADRSWSGYLGDTAELLSDKASDSLRFATIQKESHDARHDDEALRHELKGSKWWKVGGVGILAYEADDKHEERKKEVWRTWGEKNGKDEWLKAARLRTNFYNNGEPTNVWDISTVRHARV